MSVDADAPAPAQGDALFQKLRAAMVAVHQQGGITVRSQHPKTHGVVQATFQVHDVPDAYRVGIFSTAAYLPAWIRFSNGREFDDRKPDVHGMAIKLMEVAANQGGAGDAAPATQDFVLADHPVFFAKDAADFLRFLGLRRELSVERANAVQAGSTEAQLTALDAAHRVRLGTEFPSLGGFFSVATSPLTRAYFSQTPYQLGGRAVKYFVEPSSSNALEAEMPSAEHGLRDSMRQLLTTEQRAARFDFGVEVQTDAAVMPIDDATKEWKSPERVILATITIPPQEFLSDAHRAFGERLSFSPWHALPGHRPLGSVNHARRDVYEDSSIARHSATADIRQEPDAAYLNSRTLTRYFESFAAGDYRAMQSCLHPDVDFSDIGFDLHGKEVGAMWHMIIANGIKVESRDLEVSGPTGSAHWQCDYQFRMSPTAKPNPVHNSIDSEFRFEGGLIREQRDNCDFWKWFEQAVGPVGKGAHAFDFLEDKLEQLLSRSLPIDVEERVRAKVKNNRAREDRRLHEGGW